MIEFWYYWVAAALSVAVFWVLPQRFRFGYLGLASMGFIATVELTTVLIMMTIALLVFFLHDRRARQPLFRLATKALVATVALFLFYFKYVPALQAAFDEGYDFVKLLLPLGISYFAFKLIHYVIERSRKTLPDHGVWEYLAWVFFVPIFTAGPIQRFDLFLREKTDTWSLQLAWEGLTRIAIGLIKKFVIGGMIAFLLVSISFGSTGNLLENLENTPAWRVILFLVLSYLYVYMDFAGYTDIAIGTSRLFGLRIMENFNFPIFAPNIGNLWKRWHMSLANWCQSYVYMPTLGASRNPYIAVFASFIVMGLWHAASLNWLAWGLYNAAGVAIYQKWSLMARKGKWRIVKTKFYGMIGYPLTFMFFAGSFAFTMTHGEHGFRAAIRLLAKSFGIDI